MNRFALVLCRNRGGGARSRRGRQIRQIRNRRIEPCQFKRFIQFADRAISILFFDGKVAHQHRFAVWVDIAAQIARYRKFYTAKSGHSIRRLSGRQRKIQRRAESVFIRPPVLPGETGCVLLHRRISNTQRSRFHSRIIAEIMRRAKVKQNGRPAFPADHDVIGADIPMDNIGLVNSLQIRQQRKQQVGSLLPAERPALPHNPAGKRFARDVFHHNINRAVRRKSIVNVHHVRQRIHANDGSRLCNGAFFAALETILPIRFIGIGVDRHIRTAIGQPDRKIFLNRNNAIQKQIPADIGNAETAAAEHLADDILIPKDASGKMALDFDFVLPVMSALGTNIFVLPERVHADITEFADSFILQGAHLPRASSIVRIRGNFHPYTVLLKHSLCVSSSFELVCVKSKFSHDSRNTA